MAEAAEFGGSVRGTVTWRFEDRWSWRDLGSYYLRTTTAACEVRI